MAKSTVSSRRIIAVGDIHGCARELEVLIGKIAPQKDDLVVFLGDYVDRGPNSRGVIDLIIDLGMRCEVVALKGNHEAMMLDFLQQPESPGAGLFVLNGGTSTLANYTNPDQSFEFPERHIAFFRDLKLYHETEDYFFVHAGVPLQPLSTIREDEHELLLLWSRQPFLSSDYQWEKLVIHGHTPVPKPEIHANRINVDTGCVYDGALTAVELPSKKFYSVARGETASPAQPLQEPASARISMRFSGRLPVDAQRPGEDARKYETLNYNQFGLLMRDLQPRMAQPHFKIGETVEGTIGKGNDAVQFSGVVVRTESRGITMMYAIRVDRISDGAAGEPKWIERPTG